jgi:hypothetical protein
MDEKPDQIMSHIESQRDQLGRNLNELETRVKGATDWRVQFDKNPMLMMGVALGGGLLLGSIVGGSKKSGSRSSWSSSSRNYSGAGSNVGSTSYGTSASHLSSAGSSSSSMTSPAVREQRKKATDTLEHMKAALIGFATAKVKEFMTEALPGFNQHLDEAERRNTGSHQGSGSSSHQPSSGGGYSSGSYASQGAQDRQSGTSQGNNQATTRTEQSANSPYVGQTTGLNI